MMKHTIRFMVAAVVLCNVAFAQSVDEGRKFFYYEKYNSAKETLEKALAAKPDDVDAAYWLGQTLIELNDMAGAAKVYQTALQAKGSDPLLLVGMGHVELLQHKANDARQRFETAISLTKGKEINILNAVGRANVDASDGDARYALEKLKQATEVRRFKEPLVYINMGDAYRKLLDGGAAVTAYQNALSLDPKLAEAEYKIGKIYVTQGQEQAAIFLKHYEAAITLDPAYAPAYYDLYSYWYSRDVNKARDFFAKYKANTDFTPSVEAEEISLVYASGDFKGAITRADEKLQKEGDKASAKLYRVKAYAYDKLGDSLNALQNMELFFSKADSSLFLPDNFVKMAEISAKFPDKLEQADSYFNKAIRMDTVTKERVAFATAASNMYKKIGNRAKSANWLTKILAIDTGYGKLELFYAGWENFYGEQYQTADSVFSLYKQKYSDDMQGYYGGFRTKWAVDSTMEQGLPVEDAMKFTEIAGVDSIKNKSSLMLAYGYLAGYNANQLKEYEKAIFYLNKMISLDPNNVDAKNNRDILQKALDRPQPKAGTANKSSNTAPKPQKK
ncbi:tetratricopeptide repeat protein [Agriterribacter sp.]|uniref:tetratricopeptide repeat protein n=1 Tax=Agriterribacter sp. TaxID=2821509 RepID=UPI002CD54FE1|nr:tetratricopeptide repeat protein [Agriterribacter sp.]HTN06730.1 tetratricopeptide repeat protein [Agriterribacter sp.]